MLQIATLEYMCVLIFIFMFNHFHYEIIMHDGYFSRSHNCRDNLCPPLSSPIVDFNIDLYGQKSQDRPICSH